jgi:hypothetical protein
MSNYLDSGHARTHQDYYPTLQAKGMIRDLFSVADIQIPAKAWEPHAGAGHLVEALLAMDIPVYASDIEPRADGIHKLDFLEQEYLPTDDIRSIVMNPPFSTLDKQLNHALDLMQPVRGIVLMLARTVLSAAKMRQSVFGNHPNFAAKIEMVGRPRWFEQEKRTNPIHPYSWYLWDFGKDQINPTIKWINPL